MIGGFEIAVFKSQCIQQLYFAKCEIDNISQLGPFASTLDFFLHVQNLLLSCGIISFLLFYDNERCKNLQISLGINRDEFPLLTDRTTRNTFVHVDSRIDQFFDSEDLTDWNYCDCNIGPISQIQGDKLFFMRHYDSEADILTSVDRSLNPVSLSLRGLFAEIYHLDEIIGI